MSDEIYYLYVVRAYIFLQGNNSILENILKIRIKNSPSFPYLSPLDVVMTENKSFFYKKPFIPTGSHE